MKILKRILLVLVVLVALFVVIGFFLPSRYRVERSVVIESTPAAIYGQISNFKNWLQWTAWNQTKYPDMQVKFDGPETGVGAGYSWEGKSTGQGSIKFTRVEPEKGIAYDLEFEHGKYKSTGAIALEKAGDRIKVTWSNEGDLGGNPVNRYFGLMMDRMIGPDFEEGLNNLKQKIEGTGK
jgi:hypothetical protein